MLSISYYSLLPIVILVQILMTAPLVSSFATTSSTMKRRSSTAFVLPSYTRSLVSNQGTNPFNKHTTIRNKLTNTRNKHTTIRNVNSHNINTHLMAIVDPMQQVSEVEVVDNLQVDNLQIEQLSPEKTIIVFIIGVIPFIWATWEFWRRIAVGASFGTGKDSVIIPSPFEETDNDLIMIGEDNNPTSSRGRQTLDRGALTVAYVLFAVAGFSVAIALASVVMGPAPPPM